MFDDIAENIEKIAKTLERIEAKLDNHTPPKQATDQAMTRGKRGAPSNKATVAPESKVK